MPQPSPAALCFFSGAQPCSHRVTVAAWCAIGEGGPVPTAGMASAGPRHSGGSATDTTPHDAFADIFTPSIAAHRVQVAEATHWRHAWRENQCTVRALVMRATALALSAWGRLQPLKDVLKEAICHHDQSGGEMRVRWGKGHNHATEAASHLIVRQGHTGRN
jgi:hypothetical protein